MPFSQRMENRMKLTVLTDNNTIIDRYYLGEPAVSYYIECNGKKILFDVGYSDVYLQNAKRLGINLSEVDTVVLSHAHNDHTGGLRVFPEQKKKPVLVAHPLIFEPRKFEGLDIGSPLSMRDAETQFILQLTDKPCEIAPSLLFLGQVERQNNFENNKAIGCRIHEGTEIPDFLPDDSALVYLGEEGLSIITGCSHAGICNIIEYAKKITGEKNIYSVIGGFHLLESESEQVRRTVNYFANMHIKHLYPCHCTCFKARAAIHGRVPIQETGSGMSFEWK